MRARFTAEPVLDDLSAYMDGWEGVYILAFVFKAISTVFALMPKWEILTNAKDWETPGAKDE